VWRHEEELAVERILKELSFPRKGLLKNPSESAGRNPFLPEHQASRVGRNPCGFDTLRPQSRGGSYSFENAKVKDVDRRET
jgi:hypothetical protein